jgi:hypothetical protein
MKKFCQPAVAFRGQDKCTVHNKIVQLLLEGPENEEFRRLSF